MKKRFIAWLLCLCMLFTLIPAAAFGEEEVPPAAEEEPGFAPAEEPAEEPAKEPAKEPAEEPAEEPAAPLSVTSGEFWKVEENTLTITGEMVYSGDAPWLELKDSIFSVVIAEGVTAIPEKAFAGLSNCVKVRIPASVTSIGNNAFLNMGKEAAIYQVRLFTGYTQAQTESWTVADYEKYGLVYTRTTLAYEHYDETKHAYTHEFTRESTCDVQGFIGKECCCGEFTTVDMLPLKAHTPETIAAVPATCTEKGKTEGSKCSVCGTVLVEPKVTDLADHTPVAVPAKEPTDLTDGYKAGTKCSVCGKILSGCETVSSPSIAQRGTLDTDKGKDAVSWVINKDGVLYVTGTGAISKIHPWSAYRDNITKVIIAEGITGLPKEAFRKFKNCDTICIPASVAAIGDGAFKEIGSAKEEKGGHSVLYTAYTKEQVEKWDSKERERLALPEKALVVYDHYDPDTHTHWSDPVIYASCKEPRRKERVCLCGAVEVMETYPPLPHTLETLPGKAATCLEKGLTEGEKCTVCGTVTKEQVEIEALPHTIVEVKEKLPTLTEDGHTAGTKCSVCGTVLTGCEVLKAADVAYSGIVLTDEGNAQWALYENGLLAITSGKGNIKEAPWLSYESKVHIKTVVVCDGITGLPKGAFKDCNRLTTVSLPQTLTAVSAEAFYGCDQIEEMYLPNVTSIGDSAFYKCSKLEKLTLGKNLKTIGNNAFYNCKALKTVSLPEGLETIGEYAFQKCTKLNSISIPNSVKSMGKGAFMGCTELAAVSVGTGLAQIKEEVFSGDKHIKTVTLRNSLTVVRDGAFTGCTDLETVRYYGTEAQWKDMLIGLNNEPLTGASFVYLYKETTPGKVTLDLTGTGLTGSSVWIDGIQYAGKTTDGNLVSVDVSGSKASTAVIYIFKNPRAEDPHEIYPTAMYVWVLHQEGGVYVSTRMSALDNILSYAGSSIRITGKKGIRMITAVPKAAKTALTGSKGYHGYTLLEYGTIVAWAEDLKGDDLVLSTPNVKGGQAYSKAANKDAVYKKSGSQVQYTNVLVGLTDENCKPDLVMRPYMILKDASGREITLYGGPVQRSIGFIAYQNRAAFKSGTPSYEYIWSIIHAVYGDKYDTEYQR